MLNVPTRTTTLLLRLDYFNLDEILMGGLIQYPHVFYYWKRYSRRLYPPSAYGLGGLDRRFIPLPIIEHMWVLNP